MRIREDVRRYAAEQGLSEEAAIKRGLQEKAAELSKALIIILVVVAAVDVRGGVPIEVVYGVGRNKTAVKLWQDAETQLKNGDVANAHRNVEAALRSDPTLYPALYTRAKVFIRQRKYELAVQDCTNALRQDTTFVEAALLRASANAKLGSSR